MDRFVLKLAVSASATVTASSVVNAENELRERDELGVLPVARYYTEGVRHISISVSYMASNSAQ